MARAAAHVVADLDAVADDDWVEDDLAIERVEPGALWFEGGIGPLKVPREASAMPRSAGASRWYWPGYTACGT